MLKDKDLSLEDKHKDNDIFIMVQGKGQGLVN